MSKDELLRKVRSLLRLANRSPSAAEAGSATAKAKAKALMDANGLTDADVAEASQSAPSVLKVATYKNAPFEIYVISAILSEFFLVTLITRRFPGNGQIKDFCVAGMEHHTLVAAHVFKYLLGAIRKSWRRDRSAHFLPKRDRRAYILTFSKGVCARIRAERAATSSAADVGDGSSLAVRENTIKKWLEDSYQASREPKIRAVTMENLATGRVAYEAGVNTTMRPVIAGAAS